MTQYDEVPPYVFCLLHAFLTGEPLDFGEEEVPEKVSEHLENAVKSGILRDGCVE